MLIFTQRCERKREAKDTLSLDAEARSRPRQHLTLDSGKPCYLRLPRGTILQEGNCLESEDRTSIVRIIAKPESVLTVKANQTEDLLKAAYHLGNRHVPLEITLDYLRLSPDPVLEKMLEHMGLTVMAEVTPFFPELGAYHHEH
jgi:urease accessory protein